ILSHSKMVSPMLRFLYHTIFGSLLLISFILVQLSLLRILIFDGSKAAFDLPPSPHKIDHLKRINNVFLIEKYENESRDRIDLDDCKKIGEGWTKIVYECEGRAVKIPNFVGKNMRDCLEGDIYSPKFRSEVCKRNLIESLITDTITMTSFNGDPMVPQLLGYHFPADSLTAERFQVFTPLGIPIDTIRLLSVDWGDRMGVVHEILLFLQRNSHRHFADLRRQQFVMMDSLPMLIDYGDITITRSMICTPPPSLQCSRQIDQLLQSTTRQEFTKISSIISLEWEHPRELRERYSDWPNWRIEAKSISIYSNNSL
ncbi:hypothetical protein PMAYCL1PPCAC_29759, partial [Pristionchus mayeri]